MTATLILTLLCGALYTVLERAYTKHIALAAVPNADWAFAVLGAGFFLIFIAGNLWPSQRKTSRA